MGDDASPVMPGQAHASRAESASKKPSKKKHCRSRSGCLPCRRRRRKCDGRYPTCRECELRSVQCIWGLKASFHPSRSLQLSSEHTAALLALDKQADKSYSGENRVGRDTPLIFIDDTDEIIRSYVVEDDESSVVEEPSGHLPQSPGEGYDAIDISSPPGQVTISSASLGPERGQVQADNARAVVDNTNLAGAASLDLGGNFVEFTFTHPTHSLPRPDLATTPTISDPWFTDLIAAPFSLGQAISRGASPDPEPELPITESVKAELLTAYIKETATWSETTDSKMHFSASSLHHMMDSKPFVAAAMSLASRQIDATRACPRQLTLELYQYTIRLLLGHDPAEADSSILATCTLLCVYEMMASSVVEWRRHLKGCAGLLRMRKWNGDSDGIVKSCFWAFARIDVWAAFNLNQQTLIPTDSWMNEDSLVLVAARENTDDYCNLANLIFARITNILNETPESERSPQHNLRAKAQASWEELQQWRRWRLRSVKPLLRMDRSGGSPFPTIVFAISASICGNTFYHAGSILLIQSGLISPQPSVDGNEVFSPVWHARELGGISTSNSSHANWVNHLQPLFIAGTVFGGTTKGPSEPQLDHATYKPIARRTDPASTRRERLGDCISSLSAFDDQGSPSEPEDFAAEQIALLRHLAKIERETGWKTSERAKDLRVLWGLEN